MGSIPIVISVYVMGKHHKELGAESYYVKINLSRSNEQDAKMSDGRMLKMKEVCLINMRFTYNSNCFRTMVDDPGMMDDKPPNFNLL